MDEKTVILKAFLKQVRVNKFHTFLTTGLSICTYLLYKKVNELEKKLEGVKTAERD